MIWQRLDGFLREERGGVEGAIYTLWEEPITASIFK